MFSFVVKTNIELQQLLLLKMKKKKALWKLFRCESRITSLLWDDRLYRRDKCHGKGLPRYGKYSFLSKWFVFIWIKALLRNIDVSQQRYTLFQMWKYGTENICSKRRKTLNYIFSNRTKISPSNNQTQQWILMSFPDFWHSSMSILETKTNRG